MGSASQAVLQSTQSKMVQGVKVLWATTIMVALVQEGQGAPFDSPVQYHIQTDQGPERFFRFQTETGQYRKEQRHLEGSVTGTYGWVDPNGVLRLFDYISDEGGYRIDQQRKYKVGKPINNVVRIPTLGNDDIKLGFEVLPLDDELNVVEVNNEVKKRKAEPEPQVPFPVRPVQPLPNFPASTTPLVSRIANPVFRQAQPPFLSGPPLLHHPVVPILPPKVVYIQEPEEPEPETFVIGSAGTSLPDVPEPTRKFVIGAAANGAEGRKPLPRKSPAVGAAAVSRQPAPVASSRSTTVIGAATNGEGRGISSRPPPASNNNNRGQHSGIVIGLRHNNRRKRLVMPFHGF